MNPEKTEATLREMFTEYLDEDGCDVTLFTGYDIQRLHQYGELREKLHDTNPRDHVLIRCLLLAAHVYDRIRALQALATPYEKNCVRLYARLTVNWQGNFLKIQNQFPDSDIYEIVESYFKILRKYGLTTEEKPYEFLHPNRCRSVKHEGEMLKRSTQMNDDEIKVSLLEALL